MFNAYADTLEAFQMAHDSYVGRPLARTRCKLPVNLQGVDAGSLHARLSQCKSRPVAAGAVIHIPGGRLNAGRHADAILAYWDILHSADALIESMGPMAQGSTPDDAVLHLHKLLVVDSYGKLKAAHDGLRDAVSRLRRSI